MRRLFSRRSIVGVVVVLVLVAAAYLITNRTLLHAQSAPPRTTKVTRGSLVVSVGASGTLIPQHDVNLNFQSSGTVAEIPVNQGDRVVTGTVLMRLDRSQLQLQVNQAQSNLDSAQAKLDQTKAGATQKDLDTAQAQLRSAQAAYNQTVQGSRPEDIAAAAAQLTAAQAKLDALKNPNQQDVAAAQTRVDTAQAKLDALIKGALPEDIASAQAKVNQAQQNLTQTQASGSANKQQAELAMETAADNLRGAQNTWNTAYWDWQNAQNNKTDPVTGKPINDRQIQDYKDKADAASLGIQTAQQALDKAKSAYADAQTQEATANQNAQSQLDDAKAQLAKLQAPPTQEDVRQAQAAVDEANANLLKLTQPPQDDLTQAQAAVDQARANLDKLKNGNTPDAITQAQAQVDQVQAALNDLQGGPKSWDLATAMAAVDQAKAQLDLAKASYDAGELKAPFVGVVQAISVQVGQGVSSGTTVVELVDSSKFHIDANVAESDIPNVRLGQSAAVTMDALPGQVYTGTVTFVAPKATVQSGVTMYAVTVEISGQQRSFSRFGANGQTPNQSGAPGQGQYQGQGRWSGTPPAGQATPSAGSRPYGNGTPRVGGTPQTGGPPSVGSGQARPQPAAGMSASVNIIQSQKDNVLMVPTRAIQTVNGNKAVTVWDNGQSKQEQVQTGLSNGTETEVTSGLNEGDQVVIAVTMTSSSSSSSLLGGAGVPRQGGFMVGGGARGGN